MNEQINELQKAINEIEAKPVEKDSEDTTLVKMRTTARDIFKERASKVGLTMTKYFDYLTAPVVEGEQIEGEEIEIIPLDDIGQNPAPDRFEKKEKLPEFEPYDVEDQFLAKKDPDKYDKDGNFITYFKEENKRK